MSEVLRVADLRVLVADANDPDVLGETEFVLQKLAEWNLGDPVLMVGTKLDLDHERENFEELAELYASRFPSLGLSAETGAGLDGFARAVFELLDVVRVYTKRPGHPADVQAPYILQRGQTVADAAAKVHHDFLENLKFARLFHRDGSGGLKVERTHVLEDGDILEFHV
jgi:ribosome-interacting GTPase 1